MKNHITITSKGQATIPASIRRKLGLPNNGGTLDLRFDETYNQLIISKPVDLESLSNKLTSYIKPGVKPVKDVDAYFQKYREAK